MIQIDGSMGEGGGQVLRCSLALSLITGKPFRMYDIRGRRKRPGLQPQHLAAVRAAAQVGAARTAGEAKDSSELWFEPQRVLPGSMDIDIGTAGSTTLVVQTILLPLALAGEPSEVRVSGGTHNPMAPPFEFLERVFLPAIEPMGFRARVALERRGFYPAGRGRLRLWVEPLRELRPLELLERGRIRRRQATAVVARLPRHIALSELAAVKKKLGWSGNELEVVEDAHCASQGNYLLLEVTCDQIRELVSEIGELGVRAEQVAQRAAANMNRYLQSRAPVGEHLADQLLLPLALAGGSFRTSELSSHAETVIEVIHLFLGPRIHRTGDLVECRHAALPQAGAR